MFENGRTSGWRSMPSASRMNVRRAWIRAQASGYAAANAVAQARIGEGDPVLDVGREPWRSGGRDDVHLQRHPGARARPVEPGKTGELTHSSRPQLVAGVEPDPEERVAEPAVDDLLEHAARLADVERLVPLRDRLEVRGDEPLDVVADAGRQLAASSTTNPARQVSAPQTPKAMVSGSPARWRGRPGSGGRMRPAARP